MTTFGFLADDLTGASDVMAQAHAHGMWRCWCSIRADDPLGGCRRDRGPAAVA